MYSGKADTGQIFNCRQFFNLFIFEFEFSETVGPATENADFYTSSRLIRARIRFFLSKPTNGLPQNYGYKQPRMRHWITVKIQLTHSGHF